MKFELRFEVEVPHADDAEQGYDVAFNALAACLGSDYVHGDEPRVVEEDSE